MSILHTWMLSERGQVHEEEKPDNWAREICGTLVQFEDGAKVLKISLPSDFSTVHLSMLPHESSPSSVALLLAQMGFTVPIECVRVRPQGDSIHCSADIRVEDALFAKRLCPTLGTMTSGATQEISVVPTNAPMPQGTNSRRVDCKKLYSQKANDKFNAGAYRVLDQQVKSNGLSRSRGFRNPLAWTVTLTDVPATASESQVVRDVPASMRPRHVELGLVSDTVDLDTANAMVKSQLMQISSLEWWEDATESGGKRAKAKARFQDEEDARKAVISLNEMPLTFIKTSKLTVQAVHSARLKVPEPIYKAVRAMIEMKRHVWKSQHLIYIPYEPYRGHRVLKLEGKDRKEVAQAKNALEKILAGEIVMYEDEALWTPSFAINGDAYRRLKAIAQNLGVVIVRDKRQSRIHLYGSPERCREAESLLADLAKEDSSTRYFVDLNQKEFVWACQGGFKAISAALGEGVVSFDIISVPRRILVTGSDQNYKRVLNMVANQEQVGGLSSRGVTTENDCAICLQEAENTVRTRCKHTYCGDCFEAFCIYGVN
ncbi:MAG: hypothetical protein M1818_004779 [Claussenomyces sp. TS43310]|nr:MAG: hypothetical protein M1818_004779 [Claussenomyces sp. TS43310]